jgi:hypothetical protein
MVGARTAREGVALMHEPSLREFIAQQHPAAADAVLRFGPQYRYGGGHAQARTLDWNPILIALHDAGVVTPGPTIGGASCWYVPWTFARDVNRAAETLAPIVGRGWTDAALHYIMRHAYWGPAPANGRARAVRRVTAADGKRASVPLAFRPHGEPAPWLKRAQATRVGRQARRVRGFVPQAWRAAPWAAPRDIQERAFRPRQTRRMGEDESPSIAALRRIARDAITVASDPAATAQTVFNVAKMLNYAKEAARGLPGYSVDIEREVGAALSALERQAPRAAPGSGRTRRDDEADRAL